MPLLAAPHHLSSVTCLHPSLGELPEGRGLSKAQGHSASTQQRRKQQQEVNCPALWRGQAERGLSPLHGCTGSGVGLALKGRVAIGKGLEPGARTKEGTRTD